MPELGLYFTIFLIAGVAAILAVFVYLVIQLIKELKPALQEGRKVASVVQGFVEEAKILAPAAQALGLKAQVKADEIRQIIDLAKDTAAQVQDLRGSFVGFRSKEVALALKFGKNFIEEHRKSRLHKLYDKVLKFFHRQLRRWRIAN
jgi:uncharacterized protein YoxC